MWGQSWILPFIQTLQQIIETLLFSAHNRSSPSYRDYLSTPLHIPYVRGAWSWRVDTSLRCHLLAYCPWFARPLCWVPAWPSAGLATSPLPSLQKARGVSQLWGWTLRVTSLPRPYTFSSCAVADCVPLGHRRQVSVFQPAVPAPCEGYCLRAAGLRGQQGLTQWAETSWLPTSVSFASSLLLLPCLWTCPIRLCPLAYRPRFTGLDNLDSLKMLLFGFFLVPE